MRHRGKRRNQYLWQRPEESSRQVLQLQRRPTSTSEERIGRGRTGLSRLLKLQSGTGGARYWQTERCHWLQFPAPATPASNHVASSLAATTQSVWGEVWIFVLGFCNTVFFFFFFGFCNTVFFFFSVSLSLSLSLCLCLCLSVCLCLCLSVCLSVCLSLSLSCRFLKLNFIPPLPMRSL